MRNKTFPNLGNATFLCSILLSLVAVLLIGIAVFYAFFSGQKQDQSAFPAVPAVPVKTAAVAYHVVPWQVSSLGQMIAPKTIMLTVKQPGELLHLYFKSGQWVKKGQLLAKIDDSVEQADLKNAQADFIAKKINYERYAKDTLGSVQKSLVTTAKGAMLAARSVVASKQKSLDDTSILAPFSGYIGALQSVTHSFADKTVVTQVAEGAYLPVGTALATLTNPNSMVVEYELPQQYGQSIKLGQAVVVSMQNDDESVFEGQVQYVSSLVDSSSQTYKVRALVNNRQHQLHSGMQVYVTQTLDAKRQVLAVPGLSLVPTIDGYSVYTVKNNKIQAVPVSIGRRHDTWVEIQSGLKAGTEIVVSGIQSVHLGSQVKVVP